MSVSVDARRLVTRYGITIVVIGLAAFVLSRQANPASVAAVMSDAALLPFLAAVVMFYATFPIRGLRWQILLRGVDIRADFRSANLLILLNWFMNTLLPAKAGDLHRSYLASENYGTQKATALGTIAAERVIDLAVLSFGLVIAMALVVGRFTAFELRIIALAFGLLTVIGVGILVMLFLNPGYLPSTIEAIFANFRTGLTSIRSVREFGVVLGMTVVMWGLNVVRMSLVARSVGFDISVAVLVLVALLVAFLSGLPYTPAGVGVVEVVTTSVLIQAGTEESIGVSFILFDRLITVGSLIVLGGIVYLYLKFTKGLTVLAQQS